MKLIIRVGLPLVMLFAAATAAVAVAAPVPPATPFPDPPANAAVCLDEKDEIDRQLINHRFAKTDYDRTKESVDRGVGSLEELRAKEQALHLATIKLNKARYDEAKCRNDKGNDANKACIALALEYNRLVDEAAIKVALEQLAKADYDAAVLARDRGVGSQDRVDATLRDWDLAKVDVRQANRHVIEARKKITDNPACRGFQFERPEQAPPPREIPTSTTPPPAPPTTSSVAAQR